MINPLRLLFKPQAARLRKGYRWVDERTGASELVHAGLYEAVPRRGGWFYTLGSATLVLILLQIFTGIFLLLEYVPSFNEAWLSLAYMKSDNRFGDWVRGMHLWGAYVLILVIGLHMVRTFVSASYKRPRELNWVSGAILFLLVLGLAITGAMLPMDDAAYWTTVVVTNIPHYIPFVGDGVRHVLRGGDFVGPLTLTRTFAIHIWVLPFLLLTFIGSHLYLLRRHGEFGAWVNYETETDDPDREIAERIRRAEPPYPTTRIERKYAAPRDTVGFFPDQLFKDIVVSGVFIVVIFTAGLLVGAPLDERADPASVTYVPVPEWFFLPLIQLLALSPGEWLILYGSILLLAVGGAFFVLLPFLDRAPSRRPLRRPEVFVPALVIAGLVIVMALLGANRLFNQ